MDVTRDQALRFRYQQHGLRGDGPTDDCPILDLGVQDTGGPRAARWALRLRGCTLGDADLVYAWTLRGAPHAYRRREIAAVAAATSPYDEADAAKRVFDAAKPLRAAGIPVGEALDTIATHMRDIVADPTVKGELFTALTARLPEPYLRTCRPCGAIHSYEQTFRLAALRAGLELVPATSPPVLQRIPGWDGPAASVPARLDPIRAALRLVGPTTPKLIAGYLDAPVRTVQRHWPDDVVAVSVDGDRRAVLTDDVDRLLDAPGTDAGTDAEVRLLGAFDPWLQVRDRELLVADAGHRRDLWRTLGRPGAILVGHEVVGTWRPRSNGAKLRLHIEPWHDDLTGSFRGRLDDQADLLARHRGQCFDGYADA